jgi:SAM-dependent methyltransferase
MSVSTVDTSVAGLLANFAEAGPRRVEESFRELAAALWDDGAATDIALSSVPELVAALDQVGPEKQGHLAVLLGLLAESEYPEFDGPLATAVRAGLPRYLELVGHGVKGQPLTLALLYLVSHFPEDRERVLAAVAPLNLDPDDQTRLERNLRVLDLENPDLGRVWPSPSVWKLTDEERAFDKERIKSLTTTQITTNWHNDTRSVLGYAGAKAYWAVRHGASPVPVGESADPADYIPQPAPDLGIEAFTRFAGALRCQSCSGDLAFGDPVTCTSCGTGYAKALGILDLSEGIRESQESDDATSDLLQKLAEMPSMGLYYEAVLRPSFLNIGGANWGLAVSVEDEDDYLRHHLPLSEGPVLDLAAGAGRWTAVVAETVGADRLIALDMALPMMTVLRGRLPEVPAVKASALKLPFKDGSLTGVNCWNALHAFPDDAEQAISEMGRVLRPGGVLTLLTFLFDLDPIAKYFQESHFFPSRVEGMLLFTHEEIERWLGDAGLRIRHESGPGSFLFVTAEKED